VITIRKEMREVWVVDVPGREPFTSLYQDEAYGRAARDALQGHSSYEQRRFRRFLVIERLARWLIWRDKRREEIEAEIGQIQAWLVATGASGFANEEFRNPERKKLVELMRIRDSWSKEAK